MKNLPIVLFLISTATFAFAEDPVIFPDANLKAAVEQAYAFGSAVVTSAQVG